MKDRMVKQNHVMKAIQSFFELWKRKLHVLKMEVHAVIYEWLFFKFDNILEFNRQSDIIPVFLVKF